MKNKRILSGIIAAAILVMSCPALAAEDIVINPAVTDGNIITITGSLPAPKARIYIEISRQGADIMDADNIYASKQVSADDKGFFSISCEMPDTDRAEKDKKIDGYFTVHAAAAGFDKAERDFSYISEESRKNFFAELNEAVKSADSLQKFLISTDNKLMFDAYDIFIEELSGLSDSIKKTACAALAEQNITFTSDNINLINETVIAMRLNGLKTTKEAEELLQTEDIKSRYNLSMGDITYENASENLKNWFIELFLIASGKNEFKKVSMLDTLFDESIYLYEINSTHYSKLYEYLDKNSAALNLGKCQAFTDISKMSETGIQSVMQSVKTLSDSIKSIDELQLLLKQAYDGYSGKGNGSGNGSSSGSGNGGGTGSGKKTSNSGNVISSGAVPKPEPEKNEKPTEEKDYFDDLQGYDWAKSAVNLLAANGIISGDGNGKFSPGRNVTRAEFLTMLIKALDLADEEAECSFDDVAPQDWCYRYIASAYAAGITSGIDEKNFGKDNMITRQEAAVFMHRAAVRVYLPIEGEALAEFSDADKIADWAKRSVKLMKNAGLINGVGENLFEPEGLTTRVQAARMIYGLYELMQ